MKLYTHTYSKSSKDLNTLLKEAMASAEPVRKALSHFGNPVESDNPLATACASLVFASVIYQFSPDEKSTDSIFQRKWPDNKVSCDSHFGEYDAAIHSDEANYRMLLYTVTSEEKNPLLQWSQKNLWTWEVG